MAATTERILILDFGSQFTQLIARRLRELRVYCEIYPCDAPITRIREFAPRGLILSGGPFSVYDKGAPKAAASAHPEQGIWALGVPILGVCYGMQYMAKVFGGSVIAAKTREYGRTGIRALGPSRILPDFSGDLTVWMSHGDEIGRVPAGFELTAESENGSPAAMEDAKRGLYALQFHPEVAHTQRGTEMLQRFAQEVCGLRGTWDLGAYLQEQIRAVQERVGPKGAAICALSGGVDSSVAAPPCKRQA